MKLVKLTPSTELIDFDCQDDDLNSFLIDDAKGFLEKRIANTFILEDEGNIVAYFCLLNDKISRQDVTNSQWKRIKGSFPERKHFGSYPAIKIGRFAVSSKYKGQHIGTDLMNLLKGMLNENPNYSAFRYITVDAYMSAIDFYKKNDFKLLSEKIENDHTRLMFFDMMELE
ncbi:MAG: GNAT family N-acetyltransferase [Bacteroidales bacterium]|nr:GNAT family N-acetyltransferase [Bacteroidales bacterium]MBD5189994.1 GNAT family N-acetyltransferase [Bacteroidales bacterium]MBD5287949.1 GNAT family N-acetyltransferase [Bacteroides sp.]MBD5387515.1 GNAT family N-acetyltransferase [bacterium]